MVAAAEERCTRESQAGATRDAGAWVAGALAPTAGTTEERVGPCGNKRTKSDLAVGHDEDLGRLCRGMGLPGLRDRLLHPGNRGLESLASLPNRRCPSRGRTSRARTAALGLPLNERDANVRLGYAFHILARYANAWSDSAPGP